MNCASVQQLLFPRKIERIKFIIVQLFFEIYDFTIFLRSLNQSNYFNQWINNIISNEKNIIISTYFLKKYLNRFVTVQNRNTEENEIIADSQATLHARVLER